MSPVLIELGKILASDKKALNHLSMARTTASYKMRLGLAKTFIQQTTKNLRERKFSLNIDEATSSNVKRVLSILASYFCPEANKVVIEHLSSVCVTRVNAQTLFDEIVKLFDQLNIPWSNLMSILMDSCNVMRGPKSGLEMRVREKAPHLLDIDGDSCHHIHNASKKFCKPFEKYIENFFTDIYTDFRWSSDQRESLEEICMILGIKYTSITNMINHRWLSCYDAALNNLRMLDAFVLFYYAFLNDSDKTIYFSSLCKIYLQKNVSSESKAKIKNIQNYLAQKKLTLDGRERKRRIIQKIFYQIRKTKLILHFYTAALPLLKQYVCLFQTKEPLIHQLYDKQEQLYLNFLSCFIKQEFIHDRSMKELSELDISLEENHLEKHKMFLGASTEKLIIGKINHDDVQSFLEQVKDAYIQCGKYLQKILPLKNPLIKCLSAIDPQARGHSITLNRLKRLPTLVKNILSEEEEEEYSREVHIYQVDKTLPSYCSESGENMRIDEWWAKLLKLNKFPFLTKMVLALLSCFHGPQVESSFSMMGNILDKESGNMKIETFSAIQTVKYKLQSQQKSALQFFKKNNPLNDPVDKYLNNNMKSSYSEYKKEIQEKEEERERKRKELNISKNVSSKILSDKIVQERENNSRLVHKRRLEQLVKKKLKKAKAH